MRPDRSFSLGDRPVRDLESRAPPAIYIRRTSRPNLGIRNKKSGRPKRAGRGLLRGPERYRDANMTAAVATDDRMMRAAAAPTAAAGVITNSRWYQGVMRPGFHDASLEVRRRVHAASSLDFPAEIFPELHVSGRHTFSHTRFRQF